jgi:hypothetical protein
MDNALLQVGEGEVRGHTGHGRLSDDGEAYQPQVNGEGQNGIGLQDSTTGHVGKARAARGQTGHRLAAAIFCAIWPGSQHVAWFGVW